MFAQLFQAAVFDPLFALFPLVVIIAIHVVNRLIGSADEHRGRKGAVSRETGFFQLLSDEFFNVLGLSLGGMNVADKPMVDLNGPEIEIDERIGIVFGKVAQLDAAAADIREHRPVERAVALVGNEVAIRLLLPVEKIDFDGDAAFQLLRHPLEILEIAHGRRGDDVAFVDARLFADLLHLAEILHELFHPALGKVFPFHVMENGHVFPLAEQDIEPLFPFRRQKRDAAGTDVNNRVLHKSDLSLYTIIFYGLFLFS